MLSYEALPPRPRYRSNCKQRYIPASPRQTLEESTVHQVGAVRGDGPTKEGEAAAATANDDKELGAIHEDKESDSNRDDYSALGDKPSPSLFQAIGNFYKEFQQHHKINFANQLKDKYDEDDASTINLVYKEILKAMPMMTTRF